MGSAIPAEGKGKALRVVLPCSAAFLGVHDLGFSPHDCVGFLFFSCALPSSDRLSRPPASPSLSLSRSLSHTAFSHNFVTHNSFTHNSVRNNSFKHNFVTAHLSHPALSPTTPSHTYLSHTCLPVPLSHLFCAYWKKGLSCPSIHDSPKGSNACGQGWLTQSQLQFCQASYAGTLGVASATSGNNLNFKVLMDRLTTETRRHVAKQIPTCCYNI